MGQTRVSGIQQPLGLVCLAVRSRRVPTLDLAIYECWQPRRVQLNTSRGRSVDEEPRLLSYYGVQRKLLAQ